LTRCPFRDRILAGMLVLILLATCKVPRDPAFQQVTWVSAFLFTHGSGEEPQGNLAVRMSPLVVAITVFSGRTEFC
jgi:hypothetical protein